MNGNGADRWSTHQFERYAREPFWRSAPFFLLAALLVIDIAHAALIAGSSWAVLGTNARFLLVFLVVTSPLILFGAVQQQRFIRRASLPVETARPILALTFGVAVWSYALIGIVLQLVRAALRAG